MPRLRSPERYRLMSPQLNERQRRRFAATEARIFGRGGIAAAARACGMAENTVRKGLVELDDPQPVAADRVRSEGAGREPAVESDPKLLEDLRASTTMFAAIPSACCCGRLSLDPPIGWLGEVKSGAPRRGGGARVGQDLRSAVVGVFDVSAEASRRVGRQRRSRGGSGDRSSRRRLSVAAVRPAAGSTRMRFSVADVVAVPGPAGRQVEVSGRVRDSSGGRGCPGAGGAACGRRGRSCRGVRTIRSSATVLAGTPARSRRRWRGSGRRGSAPRLGP